VLRLLELSEDGLDRVGESWCGHAYSVKAKQGAVGRFDIYILPLRILAA